MASRAGPAREVAQVTEQVLDVLASCSGIPTSGALWLLSVQIQIHRKLHARARPPAQLHFNWVATHFHRKGPLSQHHAAPVQKEACLKA